MSTFEERMQRRIAARKTKEDVDGRTPEQKEQDDERIRLREEEERRYPINWLAKQPGATIFRRVSEEEHAELVDSLKPLTKEMGVKDFADFNKVNSDVAVNSKFLLLSKTEELLKKMLISDDVTDDDRNNLYNFLNLRTYNIVAKTLDGITTEIRSVYKHYSYPSVKSYDDFKCKDSSYETIQDIILKEVNEFQNQHMIKFKRLGVLDIVIKITCYLLTLRVHLYEANGYNHDVATKILENLEQTIDEIINRSE